MKSRVRGAVAKAGIKAITRDEAAKVFSLFFQRDDRILVAVSGGPDSMALLATLKEWGQSALHAVTVDHGLREESLIEAKSVGLICRQIGVPHSILSWSGPKPSSGLQQAARTARYALLCDFAREQSLTCLATAHHADDQAETVLMRLTSGSGLAGLAGMQAESVRFETVSDSSHAIAVRHIRPLLAFAKVQLVNSCLERKISFVHDQSNDNHSFERVRTRKIMQALSRDGLSHDRLIRLAARAALADEALEYAAELFLSNSPLTYQNQTVKFDWNSLCEQPKAIRNKVLSKMLEQLSSGAFVEKLERLEALIDEIDAAFSEGKKLRRSIGHWIVSLTPIGTLHIQAAPLRQRGKKSKVIVRHKN